MSTTELRHPRNRLAPVPDLNRHMLRDALLITLLALLTVGLATLGKQSVCSCALSYLCCEAAFWQKMIQELGSKCLYSEHHEHDRASSSP